MVDVTYYVALPFIAADDGVAPGEATECQSAHAAIRKAEQCRFRPDPSFYDLSFDVPQERYRLPSIYSQYRNNL